MTTKSSGSSDKLGPFSVVRRGALWCVLDAAGNLRGQSTALYSAVGYAEELAERERERAT